MNKYLLGISAIIGAIATISEAYTVLIILVAIVICLDVISGLLRAVITGEAITSERGAKGFWKKMTLLFAMAFAFFLDVAFPYILHVVNITVPKSLLFGSIVGVYIILNESISVAENLLKANNKSIPQWLKKLLTGAKNEIDKGGEKNEK